MNLGRREIHTKILSVIGISLFIIFTVSGIAAAGGLFGSPQTVSKAEGGLHTGIGYWYQEDKYKDGTDHVFRQNQIYSHLGYGARNWEMYGRIGIADLKISDAFRSSQASTTTSKDDFEDNWKFLGTLGAKVFYPFNKTFGIGAFLQGSYYFTDFKDQASGTLNGAPYTAELKVRGLWDINFGVGFQATVPKDIKLYIGPYLYYSEAKISPTTNIPGLEFSAGNVTVQNKTKGGGFAGVDIPIGRGFHLNMEGQYSERFSVGTAVTYSY
jgi:hypothetical protein